MEHEFDIYTPIRWTCCQWRSRKA